MKTLVSLTWIKFDRRDFVWTFTCLMIGLLSLGAGIFVGMANRKVQEAVQNQRSEGKINDAIEDTNRRVGDAEEQIKEMTEQQQRHQLQHQQ